MVENRKLKELEKLLNKTLELVSLYKKADMTVPFALKGNLGEFIFALELIKRFPNHKIDYRGGAFPGVDISIDNVKIQVKTQIKHPSEKFKGGKWNYESSPTIRRRGLLKRKYDILALLILYLNEDFSKIEKSNIYVFDKSEFEYFSPKFCWSGKSKGDCTIVNVLSVNGKPPPKLKQVIDFYNTPRYKRIFRTAKDDWKKIENLLT